MFGDTKARMNFTEKRDEIDELAAAAESAITAYQQAIDNLGGFTGLSGRSRTAIMGEARNVESIRQMVYWQKAGFHQVLANIEQDDFYIGGES